MPDRAAVVAISRPAAMSRRFVSAPLGALALEAHVAMLLASELVTTFELVE